MSVTFSGLVDKIVASTGRAERLQDIIKYVQSTYREIEVLAYFKRNFVEDSLTPDADPYIYTFSKNFRLMRTVEYPGIMKSVPNLPAGRIQEGQDYYWYGASNYLVFKGAFETVDTISVGYYEYSPKLFYYNENQIDAAAADAAPALYTEETDTWVYNDGTAWVSSLGTADLNEAAQVKVMNWLLSMWDPTVEEGALAKLFQRLNDDRAAKVYSVYKALQANVLKGETFESLDT